MPIAPAGSGQRINLVIDDYCQGVGQLARKVKQDSAQSLLEAAQCLCYMLG